MGRYVTKAVLPTTFRFTAGEAIAANDLLQINGFGLKAIRAAVINYCAVSNITYGTPPTSTATGRIVAATTVAADTGSKGPVQQIIVDQARNIYITGSPGGASNVVNVFKYAPDGSLLKSIALGTPINATLGRKHFFLSNGNIAVVYDNGSTSLYFQIIDPEFNVIKTETIIANAVMATVVNNEWDAIPLSGGGFAVIFASTTANLDKYGTYDNAGTVVTAVMTVNTRTGTTGNQHYRMKQLSNGNIGIAQISQNTISSIGGYVSVISVAGTSVLAFTQVTGATAGSANIPEIEVVSGFFCVAVVSTNTYVAVYNNAGTLQGSVVTVTGATGRKIITDATYFYWLGSNSTTTKMNLIRLTTAGATTTADITTTTQVNYNNGVDAFYDAQTGMIVGVTNITGASGTQHFWVVDPATLKLLASPGTQFGATATTDTEIVAASLGDGAFIAQYKQSNNTFMMIKFVNTAIIGVARVAAASGAQVEAYINANGYQINSLYGQGGTSFDHSAATVPGNKGVLGTQQVKLGGM